MPNRGLAEQMRQIIKAMPSAEFEDVLAALVKAGHPRSRAIKYIGFERPGLLPPSVVAPARPGARRPAPAPQPPATPTPGGRTHENDTPGPSGLALAKPGTVYAPMGIYLPRHPTGRRSKAFSIGRIARWDGTMEVRAVKLDDVELLGYFRRVNDTCTYTLDGEPHDPKFQKVMDEMAHYTDHELRKLLDEARAL